MVDIRTDPIIHDLFVYVSMGKNVSTKRKDNKTVMGHKKHNNQKWNITSPEFGLEISLRTENNRTEEENNKTTFPNEEGQDEWGTQQERKSGGEWS